MDSITKRYFKLTAADKPNRMPGTLVLQGTDEEVDLRVHLARQAGLTVEEISLEEERKIRRAHELIRRAKNLQTFAHSFRGQDHFLIQSQCYQVLQTHCSAWRALYRHARYVVKAKWRDVVLLTRENLRMAWLQYVRRLTTDQINELFLKEDEEYLRDLGSKYGRLTKEK